MRLNRPVCVPAPAAPAVPAAQEQVEAPLVTADIIPQGFVDSIALNMYHDGSEGLQVRKLTLILQLASTLLPSTLLPALVLLCHFTPGC